MDKTKLDTLPMSPGVYKFFNEDGGIMYIGKANNLRSRVKSYFSSDLYDRPLVKQMIPHIHDVEVVETNNEIESLVLESALIKKYKPYYNSEKKDDKSYVWIFISTKDVFPTVKIVRNISGRELKKGKIFGPYPNSSSTKRIFTYLRRMYPFCTCKKESSKECLYFHLGLCPGPHQGHISIDQYRKNINEIIKFLQGRKRGQILELKKSMKEYSREKEYEKAAKLRDKIQDLEYLGEKIEFSYHDNEETYTERRRNTLRNNFQNLKIELGIEKLKRIECYDVSNLQGKEAYTSMVVAQNGEIIRDEYRIFKIRGKDTPNDPAMLKETLNRRFDPKNRKKYPFDPDIVLIDGGKSQLSVIKDSIPSHIYIIGISKGKRLKRRGGRSLDEFWMLTKESVQKVDIENKNILIDLRNEAHRFAILHHRRARIRSYNLSSLDSIVGIGDKRRKLLMKKYGSIENIKNRTVAELSNDLKNKKVAKRVLEELN